MSRYRSHSQAVEASRDIRVAFCGTFPLSEEELEQDDDDDEEDDFDFNPNTLSTKPPRKRNVDMKIISTGRIVKVRCRLPWTWNWLQATVRLKDDSTRRYNDEVQLSRGYFQVLEYHLSPDSGITGRGLINLLLTDICDNNAGDDGFKKKTQEDEGSTGGSLQHERNVFGAFLNTLPPHQCSLENLPQILDDFSSTDQHTADALKARILNPCSLPSQVFSLAINQPTFFRSAPILYPKKLVSIVDWDYSKHNFNRAKHVAFLRTLEDIAVGDPWKFGFGDLMYKELKFSGLEAQYSAIKNVWWFEDLEQIQKDALLTYDMFKFTCRREGHCYLKFNNIPTHFQYYNSSDSETPSVSERTSALEFLIDHEVIKREVKNAEERFHLMRYWKAEESICESLEHIIKMGDIKLDIDLGQKRFERLHSDVQQMAAARCILEKPVTLVSGRGGTGKTETVSAVLKVCEEELKLQDLMILEEAMKGEKKDNSMMTDDGVNSDDSCMTKDFSNMTEDDLPTLDKKTPDDNNDDKMIGPILYCAPTGKAASVIKKRVGSKAFTIHQIISSYKMWKMNGQEGSWKFESVRVCAVDECSMVSIEVIQWLLKYLIEGSQIQKIVLLGDHLQLPSVEPGNFMEDLFHALHTRKMTVTLLTNHRSEGSIIFDNATKISRQQMPVFDSSQGFSLIIPDSDNVNQLDAHVRPHAKKLKPSKTRPIDTVRAGRKGGKDMTQDKRDLYWTLLKDYKREYNLENDEKSQIIAFLNAECGTVNQYGCFIYNRHMTWELKNNRELKSFYIGDKIICTKNSDVPIIVERKDGDNEDGGEEDQGLKYTSSTDGQFEEDPNIKLETKTERLMNGNLYKIRAEVEGRVMVKTEAKSEFESESNSKGALTAVNDEEAGTVVASSSGNIVNMRYWVLDDLAGDIVRVQSGPLIKLTKIVHAWALSIHKYQGSESETIVYGLSGSNYETWKHVYTAVTRGRKSVIIVGSYEDLKKAVKKKPITRQTALGEKVKKLLTKVEKEREAKAKEEEVKPTNSSSKPTQPTIASYLSPKKSDSKDTIVMTPNRLSQKLGDSMKMEDDDKWLGELAEDFDVPNKQLSSPSKRKGIPLDNDFSPSKLSKNHSQGGIKHLWSNLESKPSGGKRPAGDSPFTFKTSCHNDSPRSYPPGTSRQQPLPVNLNFDSMEDSFTGLDCSILEQEAIMNSQRMEVDRTVSKPSVSSTQGLVAEAFGSDESLDFGEDSDEELEALVRQSQSQAPART